MTPDSSVFRITLEGIWRKDAKVGTRAAPLEWQLAQYLA
jgi:hypothetical protein